MSVFIASFFNPDQRGIHPFVKKPSPQGVFNFNSFVGKMAFQGDSIICSVEYGKFEHGKVPVVFILNGEIIYEALMRYEKEKRELFPFIGMGHKGVRVLAKVRTLFENSFQVKYCHTLLLFFKTRA